MSALYEIGTLRNCLGQDWVELRNRVIAGLVNEKTPYYILFVTQSRDGKIMTTAIAPLRQLPTTDDKRLIGMLATILLRVDNRAGSIEEVWTLPRDIPLDQANLAYNQCVQDVSARAWNLGMPILNA